MSQYISLADLQKMTNEELHTRWSSAVFPFENASCGTCVTGHGVAGRSCRNKDHEAFRRNADGLAFQQSYLHPLLERIYALRLFYRDLYASNPPELDTLAIKLEVPIEHSTSTR